MTPRNKITGILLLLAYVCVTTALLNDAFIGPYNLQNLLRYVSLFGIIGIGALFVIVTGGIDLSIGSMVGLTGCVLTLTLNRWVDFSSAANLSFVLKLFGAELFLGSIAWSCWRGWQRWKSDREFGTREPLRLAAIAVTGALVLGLGFYVARLDVPGWVTIPVCLTLTMAVAVHLGWLHGVLITKLRLQPFVVTLCGLMCYRGLSRWLANDSTQGFGTRYDDSLRLLAIGKPCTATFVLLLAGIGLFLWGLWRILFGSIEQRRHRWGWGSVLTVIGTLLIVVASSKYWGGWTTSFGDRLFQLGPLDIATWRIEVPADAAQRPAELMWYAVYPLVAGVIALLGVLTRRMLRSGERRAWSWQVALPALVSGISLWGIYRVKGWIGDDAVTFSSSQPDVGRKMLAVFAIMGALMAGVSVIAAAAVRGRQLGEQLLLAVVAFLAMGWLLSFTAVHNTNVQVPFFFLMMVAFLAGVFLNQTIFGRYLFALGRNEEAARFSGINTDRMIILAYMICAGCAGLGGILFTLDSNNIEPSGHGSFYELYAIAAAVLGGCSLRGGEGSVIGVILGAAIMRVLFNAPNMIGVAQQLELFTMGLVILIGVVADEQIRRIAASRSRQTR
jgi:ribose/xylose/arabinose/galactoside ABC-type transport system permease subunit